MSHAPFSCDNAADAVFLNAVSFSRNKERVLSDIVLRVARGDALAILGPNGGGKTTLLKIILGLIIPDSGTVSVFGLPPSKARRHIGYVPQFSSIRDDFPATVLDMALMGAAAAPRSGNGVWRRLSLWPRDAKAKKKALDILDAFGIAALAGQPLHTLSGGQRQRLLAARALMGKPEDGPFLLLLDEPTASIDPEGKGCFFEMLATLKGDISIIVVSHELGLASPFFTHTALVDKTLTLSSGGAPSRETLRAFLGDHAPDCPVGQIVHRSAATQAAAIRNAQ